MAGALDETTALLKKDGPRHSVGTSVRIVLTIGAGMVADGWDMQVMAIALSVMQVQYSMEMTATARGIVGSMTYLGFVTGELVFGAFVDTLGPKKTSVLTTLIAVCSVTASGCITNSGLSIATSLAMCRLFTGFGIGGEHPVTAALSRSIDISQIYINRVQLLVMNIGMYQVGLIAQSALALILLAGNAPLEAAWRVLLLAGAVPSLIACYLRLHLDDELTEKQDATDAREPAVEVLRDSSKAKPHSRGPLKYFAALKDMLLSYGLRFVGTCLTWFLFNISFYGASIISTIIADNVLGTTGIDHRHRLIRASCFVLVMGLSKVAGLILTERLIHYRISFRACQCMSFSALAMVMWIFSGFSSAHKHDGIAIKVLLLIIGWMMYGVLAATTYVVPAWCFPAATRGTVVGLSAASGKAGACLGTLFFPILEESWGLDVVLTISGSICAVGACIAFLLTPAVAGEEYGTVHEQGRRDELPVSRMNMA
mmetsp:Transcript_49606/g.106209  ORF Transcript_49606/g.106209 Transcript_49606/m.106209 type:complete len:484 (+) Transcript_49606:106-1557(+)